jgi:uncharacterized membrane protein
MRCAGCFLVVALCLLLPHPAKADLRVCNRTSYIVDVATSSIKNTDSLTQGWTRVLPGDCAAAIKGPLTASSYLVYARSSLAHAGPPRAWGGSFPVCVKDSDFNLHQAVTQPICTQPDTFALPFAPVNIHGRQDWTMALDDSPALPSLTAAQLAGVKRLLTDNGYKVGTIDGLPNKPTGAALSDFRKKAGLKPADGNDALFATLEKRAETKTAPQGYEMCNDTGEPLLAAIAQEGSQPASHGWWRIAPRGCARALATPLNGEPVFLMVQRLNGSVVVGGAEKFCTAAGAFDAQGRGNCAQRSMNETGFAATAGRGMAGSVVHIAEAGIVR